MRHLRNHRYHRHTGTPAILLSQDCSIMAILAESWVGSGAQATHPYRSMLEYQVIAIQTEDA